MAKKAKSGSKSSASPVETLKGKGQALVKDINTKLKGTRKELQGQVNDLNKQIKTLQKDLNKSVEKDIKKPTMKLIDKLEKNYQDQMKKMQKEFDERVESLSALQDRLISHLPQEVIDKLHLKEAPKKTPARKPAAKKAPVAARKTAAPKPNKPKTRAPKISDIKGIGPVLQKKLAEAGIKEVSDIASPSAANQKALEEFKQTRGYETWQSQARELLGK